MARDSAYLSPANRRGIVRVLAHRGLAVDDRGPTVDENTLAAFQAALDCGADYIESDIQVTSDGVAVLFHDDDLSRIAGDPRRIDQITWAELAQIRLPLGQPIPSLQQSLEQLPAALFNLDFKVAAAIEPATKVINHLGSGNRVLATSFSEQRRKLAVAKLNGSVAESAGSVRVLALYLAYRLRLRGWFNQLASAVDCLQIPVRASVMTFGSANFIRWAHQAGLEVHFWTINDPVQMRELIVLGADGLVTDRADLARQIVDSLS